MDKVDIIKAEIERQLSNVRKWREGSLTDEESTFYDGQEFSLEELLGFVNNIELHC